MELNGRKRRIAVAEDDPIITLDLRVTLETLGYTVAGIFPTGEALVEYAAREPLDLILIDLCLAGALDGKKTAMEMLKIADLPIIILSAGGITDTFDVVRAIPAYGFVMKPFEEYELGVAIETAIARHGKDLVCRRTLQLLQKAFDALPVWAIVLDGSGTVVAASGRAGMEAGTSCAGEPVASRRSKSGIGVQIPIHCKSDSEQTVLRDQRLQEIGRLVVVR